MKKFLFFAVLGLFSFSVTAANASCSPPVFQEEIAIFDFSIENYCDHVVPTTNVPSFEMDFKTSLFSNEVAFLPSMRPGFVYHPVDYENSLVNHYSHNFIKNLSKPNNNILIKCREDTFKELLISYRV